MSGLACSELADPPPPPPPPIMACPIVCPTADPTATPAAWLPCGQTSQVPLEPGEPWQMEVHVQALTEEVQLLPLAGEEGELSPWVAEMAGWLGEPSLMFDFCYL
uniref:Uncharacterized protein n=1 Tax=Anguilla anguilla TaxID=7936 RepID=A0A0E9XED7_ANGAN